jgi:hypothetical protein
MSLMSHECLLMISEWLTNALWVPTFTISESGQSNDGGGMGMGYHLGGQLTGLTPHQQRDRVYQYNGSSERRGEEDSGLEERK